MILARLRRAQEEAREVADGEAVTAYCHLRDAVDEFLANVDHDGITGAQALALARFVAPALRSERRGDRGFTVARGGAGLPDTYLYVRLADGYEGGIDSDGATST